MNKLVKSLFVSLVFALGLAAQTQTVVDMPTGGTAYNAFTVPKSIIRVQFLSTTTNPAVVKLFDSSSTTTNYIQAAYNSIGSYTTNVVVVTTNPAGVLETNTYPGLFTYTIANPAVTNTLPTVGALIAPGSGVGTLTVPLNTLRGLTAVASQAGTLIVTYQN